MMKTLILSLFYLLLPMNAYALFGDNEELSRLEEQVSLLTVKLNIARGKIREYEQKLPILQEENTRLRVELASMKSSFDGGKMLEEEKKAIEKRLQELKRQELYIQEKEVRALEESQEFQQREQAFFEAANNTQRQIGQAEQLTKDYEYMRTARGEAEAKFSESQQQITFYSQRLVFALVICGMIILGLITWVIFILSRHIEQRAIMDADTEKRNDAMRIWETQTLLSEDERQKVQEALVHFMK
ncbi:MAG: hypothetical protein VSS52_008740 [Thiotrichaceae bacterium]|nr:hypothetical protein [Thiotrichaceae bacterium]